MPETIDKLILLVYTILERWLLNTKMHLGDEKMDGRDLKSEEFVRLEAELMIQFRTSAKPYEKSIAISYLVLQLKKNRITLDIERSVRELCSVIENQRIREFAYEMLNGVEKSTIERLYHFEEETLINYILQSEDKTWDKGQDILTPRCICQLATKILDIQKEDQVVDNCLGLGEFVAEASLKQPDAYYYGVEINSYTASIAEIRLSLRKGNFCVVTGNALEENFPGKKFNKGFSNYPFGMRIRTVSEGISLMERISKTCPELSKGTSADWIFNYRLCEMLAFGGRGIAIMSLGGLWNTIDKPIREVFADRRKIEAIIKLPARLLPITSIPVAMVVLGDNNDSIRMIDASREFVEGRRQNVMSEENITRIIESYTKDSKISRGVPIQEIAKNEFNFDPTRYLEKIKEVKNGVPFKSVIKSITRGAPYTASDLDGMSSAMPTGYQYMMLANIKNGLIDQDLPYLKEIPPKYIKYCVRRGNLLLSKNGYPFKVAVAEFSDEKIVLANGNLYVIELDTEKIDPYYLKAYLESDQGIAQLKRITVGATIPNIGVAQLNTILIPLLPLQEQKQIAVRCQAVLDEIQLYRRKIEKAENILKSLFSTGEEDD